MKNENNVIDIKQFLENKRKELYTKPQDYSKDFDERMLRIRDSLAKINSLMVELRSQAREKNSNIN